MGTHHTSPSRLLDSPSQEKLSDYLAAHPEVRRAPELSVDEEAALITALIRESVWFAASKDFLGIDGNPVRDALTTIIDYSKELEW